MRQLDFRTGFIDLLLNALAAIIVLFILSTMLINVTKPSNEGIKKDAEWVGDVSWKQGIDCDVDIWVRDPRGTIVMYKKKQADSMGIERDDLGSANDTVVVDGRQVVSLYNQEIWTLRVLIPGQYTFNIHLYACRFEGKSLKVGEKVDIPVTVKLIKLNPNYLEYFTKVVVLDKIWQEKTVLNFTLDAKGFATEKDETYVNLVKIHRDDDVGYP